jgi:hypothetical protein
MVIRAIEGKSKMSILIPSSDHQKTVDYADAEGFLAHDPEGDRRAWIYVGSASSASCP